MINKYDNVHDTCGKRQRKQRKRKNYTCIYHVLSCRTLSCHVMSSHIILQVSTQRLSSRILTQISRYKRIRRLERLYFKCLRVTSAGHPRSPRHFLRQRVTQCTPSVLQVLTYVWLRDPQFIQIA